MKTIVLSNGISCQVSDEDYEYLNQWAWNSNSKNNGPDRKTGKICIKLAFVVAARMGLEHPEDLDHKDRNVNNNQRENLRAATRTQNNANKGLVRSSTTGYKGVSFHVRANKYVAQIGYQRKLIYLGLFLSPIDAAKAYDRAAKRYFKEFAVLNFPEGA